MKKFLSSSVLAVALLSMVAQPVSALTAMEKAFQTSSNYIGVNVGEYTKVDHSICEDPVVSGENNADISVYLSREVTQGQKNRVVVFGDLPDVSKVTVDGVEGRATKAKLVKKKNGTFWVNITATGSLQNGYDFRHVFKGKLNKNGKKFVKGSVKSRYRRSSSDICKYTTKFTKNRPVSEL